MSRDLSLLSHLPAHGQEGTEKLQGSFALLAPCKLQKDTSQVVLAEVAVPRAWRACAAHALSMGVSEPPGLP